MQKGNISENVFTEAELVTNIAKRKVIGYLLK